MTAERPGRGARVARAARVATAAAALACGDARDSAIPLAPVVVQSPLHLPGVVVHGASSRWHVANAPPRHGDPVPVLLTAYCVPATTARRGRAVRAGIIAANPRLFPPARFVELYADGRHLGRFLVDNTGRSVRGNVIDIWMPTCLEARRFGRRNGTAVLAPPDPLAAPRTP